MKWLLYVGLGTVAVAPRLAYERYDAQASDLTWLGGLQISDKLFDRCNHGGTFLPVWRALRLPAAQPDATPHDGHDLGPVPLVGVGQPPVYDEPSPDVRIMHQSVTPLCQGRVGRAVSVIFAESADTEVSRLRSRR